MFIHNHLITVSLSLSDLLTILWTSVFPSGFVCSVLGGGEQLSQSGLDSLVSGDRSENSGSSSKSLHRGTEKQHS